MRVEFGAKSVNKRRQVVHNDAGKRKKIEGAMAGWYLFNFSYGLIFHRFHLTESSFFYCSNSRLLLMNILDRILIKSLF